jgi:hypothetical protein
MNWALAISRNRTALLAVVASIVALIGGRDGGAISRELRNAALALLRPAESAVRRLIVIAARGLVVAPRPAPVFAGGPPAKRFAGLDRPMTFRLFDPRKHYGCQLRPIRPVFVPRIRTFFGPAHLPHAQLVPAQLVPAQFDPAKFDPAQPIVAQIIPALLAAALPPNPDPQAAEDTSQLRRRLAALERALADLPRQARRLARWRARNATASNSSPQSAPPPPSPLRIGHPPGHCRTGDRQVDLTLRECHLLATDVLADTC